MERKAKYVVRLDAAERGRLQAMVAAGKGSKTIRQRAFILLKADEGEYGPGWPDTKIAEAFEVGGRAVERTRRLLVPDGFEAVLVRKPSPNRQYRERDGAREAELVKLACSKPPAGRARWTLQLLADRLVERKVVASIGREAVRVALEKNDPQPWPRERWVIPPDADAEFVCGMEDVPDVYQRPYDATRPVVCLDEASKQLIRETRTPIPATPGRPERVDSEYERNGTVNLFLTFEPLAGRRRVAVTARRTKVDFAHVLRELLDEQ